MAEAIIDDAIRVERMRQERRLYHDFLSLNYRVFERYVQIREVFACSFAKTHSERIREQEQLEEINIMLTNIGSMILNLEKNSEPLLFSD